jgi:hypothetical protein
MKKQWRLLLGMLNSECRAIRVFWTSVVGSMSIVVHKLQIRSPRRQQTVWDASWLSAGPAGSRSAARGLARIADDCSVARGQSHWISVPGKEALA